MKRHVRAQEPVKEPMAQAEAPFDLSPGRLSKLRWAPEPLTAPFRLEEADPGYTLVLRVELRL